MGTAISNLQRLRNVLDHREDRVPIDFGATTTSGIHVSVIAELRRRFGLEDRPVRVIEPYQMLGDVDDELKEAIGIDTCGIAPRANIFGFEERDWKEWRAPWGQIVLVPGGFEVAENDAGDTVIFPEGDRSVPPSAKMPRTGYFFDSIFRQEPIVEDEIDPWNNCEEFTQMSGADLAHIVSRVGAARATGRLVVANIGGTALGDIALVPAPFLKHPRGIRDVTEWYISTVARTALVHTIFAYETEVALVNLQMVLDAVGPRAIDVLYICGTDFGTQTSQFCSADTFRELYTPYYLRMNDWIHRNTEWKCFKHSCGAVVPLIPELIAAGFDILNPVQVSAAGMDPLSLKERFGHEIVFWGGGVDTQRTLPFGTPAEVRREVLERCRAFAPGGGFVFNTIHNVQAQTPTDNFISMINAVREFNGEPQIGA